MERIVAHILLLVLSLGAALVVAGRPAGTSGEVAAIRLPSDGKGEALGHSTIISDRYTTEYDSIIYTVRTYPPLIS
jgi:hypothetical protein